MQANVSEQRLFIVCRLMLGALFFFYYFDLFFDYEFIYMLRFVETKTFFLRAISVLGIIGAIFFSFGLYRKLAGFLLIVINLALVSFAPFVINVSFGYLNYLLLILFFVPATESWSAKKHWQFSKNFMLLLWFVSGLAYLESGITKLNSPMWINGQAVSLLFVNSVAAKSNFITSFILKHGALAMFLTWAVIAVELLLVFLSISIKTRRVAGYLALLMHLLILLTMQISHIAIGMLIFHLFLFCRFDLIWPARHKVSV